MNNETRDMWFLPGDKPPRKLASDVKRDVAVRVMHEFLEERNYKSYYTRVWDTDEGTMFDVGSWSEFFLWGTPEEGECQNEK